MPGISLTKDLLCLIYHRRALRDELLLRALTGASFFTIRDGGPSSAVGPHLLATHLARHHHLKPMKHNLTLDHVKKEATDLLHGLQRRDPEALRRCDAIDPLTDLSSPDLFYARFIMHMSTASALGGS
jgi:hypothetical protein